MQTKQPLVMTSPVRLPASMAARLQEVADEACSTRSQIIRHAIKRYLDGK